MDNYGDYNDTDGNKDNDDDDDSKDEENYNEADDDDKEVMPSPSVSIRGVHNGQVDPHHEDEVPTSQVLKALKQQELHLN